MTIRKSILIFAVVAVCLASYFNALFGGFVWDDNMLIAPNQFNRSFKFLPQFFVKEFLSVYDKSASCGYYRPLLAALFMSTNIIWKENHFGYHLTNLIFHILVCALIFVFVELLIKDKFIAFVSSLVFAVHPIHTESVNLISNISYVASAAFFMSSLILFIKYAIYHKRFILYCLSVLCFCVSLLIIENTIVLPLIVICIDFLFLSQRSPNKVAKNFLRFHLTFFVMTGLYLLVRTYIVDWSFVAKRVFIEANFNNGIANFWRVFTSLKIFAYYVRILFFPYALRVEYFLPAANSLFEPAVISGLSIFILLSYLIKKNIKDNSILSFSLLWFLVTLLPLSNIMPLGNIFAERYMYIPSVGFCMGIGFLFSWLLKRNIKTSILGWQKSIIFVFILLIVALGRVTYERNKVWEDDLTLWSDAVEKSPFSARAHINLAATYYNLGLFDEALAETNLSLGLNPFSSEAVFTLGSIYLKKGLIDQAISEFNRAIDIMPVHSKSYVGLSAAYFLKQQYKDAIQVALTALEKNPYLDDARYNLAISYRSIGKTEEAIDNFRQYLKNNPDRPDVYLDLGYLYYNQNDHQKAREYWLRAQEIAPECQPARDALKLLEK